ncbi:putative leader peptide [Micromonospora avicenniae]|uniref:putative leader peptide n=1 Tax=Micromonospora avicenniae TaxID=1198245 RepID=UPI003CCBAF9D
MAGRRGGGPVGQRHRPPGRDCLTAAGGVPRHTSRSVCRLTARRETSKICYVRSVHLTKRGHIDLLRVASAACRRSL